MRKQKNSFKENVPDKQKKGKKASVFEVFKDLIKQGVTDG